MVTKVTFVGPSFTRKPPKYERFIRPTGLRFTKCNVTHPELQATFQLQILGVKKNPQSGVYTTLVSPLCLPLLRLSLAEALSLFRSFFALSLCAPRGTRAA